MERFGVTIPTGDTTPVVQAYYNYLYRWYYLDIHRNRATTLLWSSPIKIAAWGVTLILILFLLTYYFYYVHRGRDELYEATSFAGSLLERNGKVSIFTWFIIFGLFAAVLYIGIRSILFGFIY